MKLSEAIRKGCEKTKPAYGTYHKTQVNGEKCSCALGAAIFATNIETTKGALLDRFPFLRTTRRREQWFNIIARINDHHILTREQIADMLETMGE
jgi:hypothetical protein